MAIFNNHSKRFLDVSTQLNWKTEKDSTLGQASFLSPTDTISLTDQKIIARAQCLLNLVKNETIKLVNLAETEACKENVRLKIPDEEIFFIGNSHKNPHPDIQKLAQEFKAVLNSPTTSLEELVRNLIKKRLSELHLNF